MAFTALSMLTHGWHHAIDVDVIIDEAPLIPSIVEVRPTVRANVLPPDTSQDVPVVVSAEELRPVTSSSATPAGTSQDKPVIIDTDDLRPVIRKVKEE